MVDKVIIEFSGYKNINILTAYSNYIVKKDGTVISGNRKEKTYLLVALEGGRDDWGNYKDTRTTEQNEALFLLMSKLILIYDLDAEDFLTGRDIESSTDRDFSKEKLLNELNDWLIKDMIKP